MEIFQLIEHVTLAAITGTTIKESHCNSLEDRAPVDGIYGGPIFKWIVVTWLHDRVPG